MSHHPWARRAVAAASALALAATGLVAVASAATADTAPAAGVPATVTADPLPTTQIDGVAWHVGIAGNKVYAGGEFTRARPAGANPGQNEVVRNNLLAFNLQTGVLDTAWAPNPNGAVRAVAVSPDGSRVYVGGSFTTISGQTRQRIAAYNTSNGQLITSFNARTNAQIRAIAVTDDTVYVGGIFSTANGQSRNKLAAFRASDGALLPWDPNVADNRVNALSVSPDGTTIIAGGGFTTVGGTTADSRGMVRLDATTGAKLPFPANAQVYNSGDQGAILQIRGDADNAYLVGYTFGRAAGNLEGVLAVDWDTGALTWLLDCHGDTYDVAPMGDVVYSASHHHYCGNVRAIPQTPEWEFYRANAMTKSVTQANQREHLGYFNHEGKPAPTVLSWNPQVDAGTFTGQNQGGWTVDGDGQYLVMGGEFPRINNTPQQGLVRFATSDVAPDNTGPRFSGSNWPEASARAIGQGAVRVSWLGNFDYDNEFLTYRVIRNGNTGNPAYVGTHASRPWNRPWMGFTDTGLTPGATYTYQVRVTDPFGNQANTATFSVVADGTGQLSDYAQRVMSDGASHYWRLDDAPGSGAALDTAAVNNATTGSALTKGEPGAIAGDPNTAYRSTNNLQSRTVAATRQQAVYDYTIETWFKAPANSAGGHLVGFGTAAAVGSNSSSNNRDRAIYMDNTGRLQFVLNVGQIRAVRSPDAYRDDQWHHAAATVSTEGMKLYVDGVLVGSRTDTTTGRNLSGFWRIGDAISGWPNAANVSAFTGSIDEVAIYPTPLTAEQIAAHHLLGTTGAVPNFPPTAAATSEVDFLDVAVDGTGSSDPDGSIASYAWDFGDGATATGPTATHTYAAAGTYPVTLTVTDDDGATGTTTTDVVATDPPDDLAQDAFARSVSGAWGPAGIGGAWTSQGTTSRYQVAGGTGNHVLTGGASAVSLLPSVANLDTEVQVTVGIDQLPAGNTYATAFARRIGDASYGARIRIGSGGDVALHIVRGQGTTLTPLAGLTIPGQTYTPGDRLQIKVQAEGTGPTTIRAKVWTAGTPEPAAWTATTTDATTALQGPGAIGVMTYLGGSAPRTISWDNLWAAGIA